MSKTVQFKRGNANVSSTYTGADGEITVNTTDYSLNVHDGVTPGGHIIVATGNLSLGNLSIVDQTIFGTTANSGIVLSPNNSSVFLNANLIVSNVAQLNYNSSNNWAVLSTNPTSLADMQIFAGNTDFNSAIYLWSNLRKMSFNTLSNAFDFNFNGQLSATDFTASKNSAIGYSFYAEGQGYSGFSHIAGPPDYIRIMHEGIDYARFYSNYTMNLTGNLIISSTANLFNNFPDAYMQIYSDVNSYAQLVKQNRNNGSLASTDIVVTADNGTDSSYYLNMGIASSNHIDSEFFGDTNSRNDSYLYSVGSSQQGPSSNFGGNLLIGSTNGIIKFFVGNTAEANVVVKVTSNALLPGANVTQSLGSSEHQWKDLWVSNNTIYIGGFPLSISNGITTFPGSIHFGSDSFKIEQGQGFRISSEVGIDLIARNTTDVENPVNYDWNFSTDGILTFPNGTAQTNAWSGGRIVSAPSSSAGALGDKQGDIAFTSGYIYYCIEDFTGESVQYDTTISNLTENAVTFVFSKGENITEPEVGWFITIDPSGVNITHAILLVEDLATDWRVTWAGSNTSAEVGTSIRITSSGSIWKRVAWSEDTW
jgi:hypothetical protein